MWFWLLAFQWARHPLKPLRTRVMCLPTVWSLGCGDLVGLVFPDAVLRRVDLPAHPTPGGVTARDLEVVEVLGLTTSQRLTLVGA